MQVLFQPISSQVDSASTNGTIDLGSIYGRVKPKTVKKSVFTEITASLLDV